MAIGTLFGTNTESVGLYGTPIGGSVPSTVYQTYLQWFVFKESIAQPATPTGGSWDFSTNVGTAPATWAVTSPNTPVNPVWFSTAFVDSRNPTVLVWTTPSILTGGSVAAAVSVSFTPVGNLVSTNVQNALTELGTTHINTYTGDGTTVNFTLSFAPHSTATMQIFINGVYQNRSSFSVITTTLTFTQAPPLTSLIEVTYY